MEIFRRWGIEMPDERVKIYGGGRPLGAVIACLTSDTTFSYFQ